MCGRTKTFWRSWGDAAPELLLIHCTLAHSGAWRGLANRLGRPALAFDLPGHGRSGARDAAVDYQAQSLAVAESFVQAPPMDIIGHSFGATVALRMAVERPELVRRLVLIEPVFFAAANGTPDYDTHVAGIRPFARAMQAGDLAEAARMFTAIWGTGVAWEDMRTEQRDALTEQMHIIPAQDGALFQDNANLLAPGRLEAVQKPVLLLEGGESPPIIDAISRALCARLPNANRHVIDGAGHMLPITHPGETAALVAPFLLSP